MCGILVITSSEQPIDPKAVEAGMRALAHRGPDEQHVWYSQKRKTALGHTRLSIIDLETGAQPIANEDGSMQIVVNGEFYDYERLQQGLTGRGHRLKTRSDSEVALHLFEELGPECLTELRGEFALAIWDENERTLFAARDRFGIKPLFYAEYRGQFMLASEVKALFAMGLPAAWSEDGMFQTLHFAQRQDATMFAKVRQVPPGHYVMIRDGSVRVCRYWDAHYPERKEARALDVAQETEQVLEKLKEAVDLRTRADVPIGCYLSGGVDSSAVLGMARECTGENITAFSVAFDHPDYDESGPAAAMAAHAGVDFHPVRVTGDDFAEAFEASVTQGEILHYNGHGTARYLLSQTVHEAGIKSVLGGEGADELFGGYGFARKTLQTGPRSALKTLNLFSGFLKKPGKDLEALATLSPMLARLANAIGFPESMKKLMDERIPSYRRLLAPAFLERHRGEDPFRVFLGQFRKLELLGREPFHLVTYLWLKSYFVNYVLAGERLDMGNAVEVRLPFLDHMLFEHMKQIPPAWLHHEQQNKFLLRRAVEPFVCKEVLRGPKKPFFAPPGLAASGAKLNVLMEDLVRSRDFGSIPFFDQKAALAFMDRLGQATDDQMKALDPIRYLLASAAVLNRHYRLS